MEVGVLGPLRVRHDGLDLPLGTPQQRSVLALLAVRAGQPVTLQELIYELWDERPPPSAVAKVRGYAAALRRMSSAVAAPVAWVVRSGSGYLLDPDTSTVDLDLFTRELGEGRHALAGHDLPAALARLEAALGCWRGVMLDGLPRGPVLAGRCAVVEQDRLAAVDTVAKLHLGLGNAARAAALILPQVQAEPLREQSYALLMRALYQTDGAAAALRVYETIRQALVEQLGVEPGAQLQRLHRAVLNRDAELDPPDPAHAAPPGGHRPKADVVVSSGRADSGTVAPTGPATSSEPVVPRTLPADTADFTGRTNEIRLLREELSGDGRTGATVATITGRGGVGKSTLCVHVAHMLLDEYPDGQLYVDLHGLSGDVAAEPITVLGRFLRLLGVDDTAVPDTLDERAELYRNLLANRRVLVVLDNAADDTQLLPLIPAGHTCGVIATSRVRLGASVGVATLNLGVLSMEEAVRLLTHIVGPQRSAAEPDAVAEVARMCDRLPLALRIAGWRLAARPHWNAADLVHQLRDSHTRLDRLSLGNLDVRECIGASYAGLAADAKRLLAGVGDLGIEEVERWISAALLDGSMARADDVLEQLVDAQLAELAGREPDAPVRYRIPDLICLFAAERAGQDGCRPQHEAARIRVFGACLSMLEAAYMSVCGGGYLATLRNSPRWGGPGLALDTLAADPLRWFDREAATIATLLRRAASDGHGAVCWELGALAALMFRMRRRLDVLAEMLEIALTAARNVEDIRGQAVVLTQLGLLCTDRADYPRAVGYMKKAVRLFEQVADWHGHAVVTTYLGTVLHYLGEDEKALAHYGAALPTLRDLADHGGVALALRGMGQIRLRRRCFADAERYFTEALASYRKAGSRRGLAHVTGWQAMLRLHQERYADAEAKFQEALDAARALGDRPAQAQSLHGLSLCCMRQGALDRAGQMLTEALEITSQPWPGDVESQVREAMKALDAPLPTGDVMMAESGTELGP
jgi:DNA-binding SARP family transcriptional activator/tetratricopeptide (TPR) repeat protein